MDKSNGENWGLIGLKIIIIPALVVKMAESVVTRIAFRKN